MRDQVIQRVLDTKIIAIVRGVYGDDCLRLAEALCAGGIELLEVTFDQLRPESFKDTQAAINAVAKRFDDQLYPGAGTVTSIELVNLASDAGAMYAISPNFDQEVVKRTRELGMISMPGALTPTEVLAAHNAGADFVKLFPAAILGAGYVKAIRSPLNHVKLLVVGGVNETNLSSLLVAGAVGAGVGGNLVNKQWIAEGKFQEITRTAKNFVEIIRS